MMAEHKVRPTDAQPDHEADLLDDPRVAALLAEYQQRIDRGEHLNRQEFVNRYPELASAVACCLEGLELMRGGLGSRRKLADTSPAVKGSGEPAALPPNPLGDFQIVREIARGGMGIVYEAVQLSLGRRVALKVLPFAATLDARQLQRFRLEAQAAALLHHTHIVPIYAVGCERGVHFYAMQLIEGQSLAVVIDELREQAEEDRSSKHRLKDRVEARLDDDSNGLEPTRGGLVSLGPNASEREARLSTAKQQLARSTVGLAAALTAGGARSEAHFRRVAQLMLQAASALEHAHQAGVVHRDIKPANLLIDAAGNLWITDFGLALLQTDQGLTRSGDVVGTIRYMSPEQTRGQRTLIDERTDVYSLGAAMYELLTLEPVFSGNTQHELLLEILDPEPRRLRAVNPAVPVELETIVLKSLSKTPADRYCSAAALAADLQRYLNHQPILARPPSLLERARKWSRRHPAVVAAGMLMLAVVAVASLVSNRLISLEERKTAAALEREKLRAAEAERHFQQARQAVDALFQISEEELADKPAETARRRILEVVLSHYQDFLDQRRGDAASQAELAAAQEKVQSILRELELLQREMQLRLLAGDLVQRDLGLSPERRAELNDLLATWSAQRRELFDGSDRDEATRRATMVAWAEEHDQELARMLTPEELHRFRQICIQSQGVFAFKEPEVVRRLGLTASQRAEIRNIERQVFAGRFRGPGFGAPGFGEPRGGRPGGPDFAGTARPHEGPPGGERPMRERGPVGPPDGGPRGPDHIFPGALHEEAIAGVVALLTPEQANRWEELIGKPLEGLVEPPFRPRPVQNRRAPEEQRPNR
jgi:hypothetical protein